MSPVYMWLIITVCIFFMWRTLFVSKKEKKRENYHMAPIASFAKKIIIFGVCALVAFALISNMLKNN